jgi:hypothetical protein
MFSIKNTFEQISTLIDHLFISMIDDGGTDQIFCHVKKIQYKLRRLMIDTEK